MTINIDKRFFSLRLKYDILVDGIQEFIAKSDILHIPSKPRLSLYDLSNTKILSIRLASLFYAEYDLIFIDGEKIELRLEENSENIFSFYYQENKHTIHYNSNDSASIFKGNEKIADLIREQKFEDFIISCYNNRYKIITIAIVLAYDFSIQKSSVKYH